MTVIPPCLRPTAFLALTLALAACGSGKPAAEADHDAPANEAVSASPLPAMPPAANPAAALARYVDKYPGDAVGGRAWKDDPLVIQAVEDAVTDTDIRHWVLAGNGPASPIGMVGGRIASWACEAHDCNAHQWVTLIDPTNGTAQICYVDDTTPTGKARWFAKGMEELRAGGCPDVET